MLRPGQVWKVLDFAWFFQAVLKILKGNPTRQGEGARWREDSPVLASMWAIHLQDMSKSCKMQSINQIRFGNPTIQNVLIVTRTCAYQEFPRDSNRF